MFSSIWEIFGKAVKNKIFWKMSRTYGVTIALTLTILAVNIAHSEMSSEEREGREYAELIACKNETDASDIDVARLMIHANPITQSAKCLSACFLYQLGVTTKDKLIPENVIDYVDDVTLVGSNGKTLDKVVKEVADECKDITDPDECEFAAKILVCLNAAVKKRGFCPNVF